MVGEIVVQPDVRTGAVTPDELKAPGRRLETAKRCAGAFQIDPRAMRGGNRGKRIGEVVRSGKLHDAFGFARSAREPDPRAVHALGAPIRVRGTSHRKALHRRPASLLQQLCDIGVRAVDDQLPASRRAAQQQVELPHHRFQVGVDVGVVVLDIVDDHGAGAVVQEFRVLVEERRIVFVPLDDEVPAASQPRRAVEVSGRAADQKAGFQAGVLQQPGHHAGRGGLAVRPGHRDDFTAGKNLRAQPLGAGKVLETRVQQRLHDRHSARHHVAHQHQVGSGVQLPGIKAGDRFDSQFAQVRAHRRPGGPVGAGDFVTEFARQGGKPAHEGPADAENMNMHQEASSGMPKSWVSAT